MATSSAVYAGKTPLLKERAVVKTAPEQKLEPDEGLSHYDWNHLCPNRARACLAGLRGGIAPRTESVVHAPHYCCRCP